MTVLSLGGSLDTAAAGALHQELLSRIEARQPLLLDGSGVTRVWQACLQLLAGARRAAAAAGVAYAITAPSPALADMASLARLDAILEPLG